jgi:hypothetical protein
MKKSFALLGALLLALSALSAQVRVDMVRALSVNGSRVSIPVYMMPPNSIGDLARGGPGGILVDPSINQQNYEFYQYVLAHEAGHAVGITTETGADYYAGKLLRLEGFTPRQMNAVCWEMLRVLSPDGDATHPPSSVRVRIVMAGY